MATIDVGGYIDINGTVGSGCTVEKVDFTVATTGSAASYCTVNDSEVTGAGSPIDASDNCTEGTGTISGWTFTGGATNYPLAAAAGAFTLTGGAATFSRDYELTAAAGAFTLTGQDVTFGRGYDLEAGTGTFTLTGNALTFSRTYNPTFEDGTFTLTGNDLTFARGYYLAADDGTFALTGNDLTFSRSYALTLEDGTFTLTGNDLGLLYQSGVTVSAMSVSTAGDLLVVQLDSSSTSGANAIWDGWAITVDGTSVPIMEAYWSSSDSDTYYAPTVGSAYITFKLAWAAIDNVTVTAAYSGSGIVGLSTFTATSVTNNSTVELVSDLYSVDYSGIEFMDDFPEIVPATLSTKFSRIAALYNQPKLGCGDGGIFDDDDVTSLMTYGHATSSAFNATNVAAIKALNPDYIVGRQTVIHEIQAVTGKNTFGHGPIDNPTSDISNHATSEVYAGHWMLRPATDTATSLAASTVALSVTVDDDTYFASGQYAIIHDGDWTNAEIVKIASKASNVLTLSLRAVTSSKDDQNVGTQLKLHGIDSKIASMIAPAGNWCPNISSVCPEDGDGNQMIDAMVEWVVGEFTTNSYFDRMHLDVGKSSMAADDGDLNNDGTVDFGMSSDGSTSYITEGTNQIFAAVRAQVGRDITINGGNDAVTYNQNMQGTEYEGFPVSGDLQTENQNATLTDLQFDFLDFAAQSGWYYTGYGPRHLEAHMKSVMEAFPDMYGQPWTVTGNNIHRLSFALGCCAPHATHGRPITASAGDDEQWWPEWAVDKYSGISYQGNVDSEATIRPHLNWMGPALGRWFRVITPSGFTSGDLITNGDFDSALSGWTAEGSTTVTRETSDGVDNGAYLKISTPAPTGTVTDEGVTGPLVAVSATTQYTLTFYARSNRTDQRAYFEFETGVQETPVGNLPLDTTWRKFVIPFYSLASGNRRFKVRTGLFAGEVHIDKLKLFASPSNVVGRHYQHATILAETTGVDTDITATRRYRKILGQIAPTEYDGAYIETGDTITVAANDGLVLIPNKRLLMGGDSKITISGANFDVTAKHKIEYTLLTTNSNVNNDIWWSADNSDNYDRLRDNGTFRSVRSTGGNATLSPSAFTANTEYKVTVVTDNTANQIDITMVPTGGGSTLTGTLTCSNTVALTTGIIIGQRPSSAAPFNGYIKDFKVYNSSDTLIHHWPINEVCADGGTIYDRVGTANGVLTLGASSTWQDDTLSVDYPLVAEDGTFALTGQDITFKRDFAALLEAGTFTLTGQDAGFQAGYALGLGAGSFTLTGQDVTFKRDFAALLDAGTFVLSGKDLSLQRDITLLAEDGTFALTGQDVTLDLTWAFAPDVGEFTLSGKPLGLAWSAQALDIATSKFFYSPVPAFGRDPAVNQYLYREFSRVSQASNQDNVLPLFFREPDQVIDGMMVLAAGDPGWNPGHGRGVYAYFDAQWVPCGTRQTYWDDEKTPAGRLKQGQTDKPDYDYTLQAMLMPQNDTTEILYLSDQLTHSVKEGTSVVYPHVHYLDDGRGTPTFKIDYRFYNNGSSAIESFTTISTDDGTGPVFTYTSGTIAQIIPFKEIVIQEMSPSMLYDIRFYRDDNLAGGDIPLKSFDFHIEKDWLGTREEFIK